MSEKTLDLLAEITEPRPVTAKPKETFESVLRRTYGDYWKVMAGRAKSLNPGYPEGGSDSEVVLRMPAGPYVMKQAEVLVAANMTQSLRLPLPRMAMGGTQNKMLPNGDRSFTKSRSGVFANFSRQRLPVSSLFVSYPLKAEFAANPKLVEDVLGPSHGMLETSTGKPIMILPIGLSSVSGSCDMSPPPDPLWFSPVLGLADVDVLRLRGGSTSVTAAFLDTGVGACELEEGEQKVPDPRFYYWTNRSEASLDTSGDDDGDGYKNDIHGVDVTALGGGEAEPFNNQDPRRASDEERCDVSANSVHGTHVAGILSGSIFGGELGTIAKNRIRLLPIKITGDDRGLDDRSVRNAFNFLRFHKADGIRVVNLSYADANSGSSPYKEVLSAMKDTLFVAAAGNVHPNFYSGEQVNLDKSTRLSFPARLAKDNPNVMTVAALSIAGGLADFSYYGPQVVDLAAPGERIQSTVRDFDNPNAPEAMGTASGTSQAAPFVSAAAALLFLMDYKDPAMVRRRLICSTDFRPQLRDFVWSSGSLNIAKALSIYDDVIDLTPKDGVARKPVMGLISRPLNLTVTLPPEAGDMANKQVSYPIEQVRKIIPEYRRDDTGRMWSAIIVSTEHQDQTLRPTRNLRFIRCLLDVGQTLEIVKDLGGRLDDKTTQIAWSDVAEVTVTDPPSAFNRDGRKNRLKKVVADMEPKLRFGEVPETDIR